jgi:3-dehydroquinate dehydratase
MLSHNDVTKLVLWARENEERLRDMNLTRTAMAEQASKELGITVRPSTVRALDVLESLTRTGGNGRAKRLALELRIDSLERGVKTLQKQLEEWTGS